MNREQAKEELKSHMVEYLHDQHGIMNVKKLFKCLNPKHRDEHPSMGFHEDSQKVHCFSCNITYDIIDLIKMDHNLNDKEAFEYGYNLYHIDIDHSFSLSASRSVNSQHREEQVQQNSKEQTLDISKYFEKCRARIDQTDYPQQRGLTQATIERFGLGFDPLFKKGKWKALIIPTGPSSYVARNTDPNAEHGNRIRKFGSSPIFNVEALSGDQPVFVTEGEIDALSIIDAGGSALALGSASNVKRFLNYFDTHPELCSRCFLLIGLDNDKQGEKAAGELMIGLKERKIAAEKVNISGSYKDPNEALIADKISFVGAIREAIEQKVRDEKSKIDSYLKNSVSESMQEFFDLVKNNAKTPPISTGFASLDRSLGRGLHPGLYVIGAIPSLGKTAFVLQIADNIASSEASSHNVLIFSLEMSKHELMARSISRETFKVMTSEKTYSALAKTTYGILDGDMYENYSKEELNLIEKAEVLYGQYGRNIFILEGQGELGVLQVREAVEKHIQVTGNVPVVVIDYLQLLAPYNLKATDKQNVDKAVLELKRISRDFNAIVIAISSFNRTNYNSSPTLSSFKESGAVEYSGDVVIGLFFEGLGTEGFDIDKARRKNPRDIVLKVIKNRNGEAGQMLNFSFNAAYNFFQEGHSDTNMSNRDLESGWTPARN